MPGLIRVFHRPGKVGFRFVPDNYSHGDSPAVVFDVDDAREFASALEDAAGEAETTVDWTAGETVPAENL